MFLFDIVPPQARRGPWRVMALSKTKDLDSSPVIQYLNSLTQEEADSIIALFEAFTAGGINSIPTKTRHEMDEPHKIFEFIKGRHRIAWFYDAGKIVICTHGFLKRTKTTPIQEKEMARRVKRDYEAARDAGKLEILRVD